MKSRTAIGPSFSAALPSGVRGPEVSDQLQTGIRSAKQLFRCLLQKHTDPAFFGGADKNQRPSSLKHFLQRAVSPAFRWVFAIVHSG